VELDRETDIVDYDLCQTLDELRRNLNGGIGGGRPVFAYSLPQNLHISRIRFKPAPTDSTYAGFFGQAAAQIQHMDGCFGTFIEALKENGLYDDSVIVLTADHGDLLGEFRRWGHSYLMAPEIARIPLIVHLPPRLRERFAVDPTQVALSTDITPSLYALLGYHPADLGSLFGRSLFHDRSESVRPPDDRPQLLASSYGAVYAVVRDRGRRLYVADGVNNREYAYDLSDTAPLRIGIDPNDRTKDRGFIRQQLNELASLYRFSPEP
jgi:arylsulfatase A-like enzyme